MRKVKGVWVDREKSRASSCGGLFVSGRIPFGICVPSPRSISGSANGAVRDNNVRMLFRQELK
jgi:hypothetical protein